MKVLVTGAHGDIADAVGRILLESKPMTLHGADASASGPGLSTFQQMFTLPRATRDAAAYRAALAELAARERYDLIIPCPDAEIAALADVEGDTLPLLMNAANIVHTFCDKLETAHWLARHGLPGPETWPLSATPADRLPVFTKPRIGWGSRNLETVRTEQRLEELWSRHGDTFVGQELLDGSDREHTCAVLCAGNEMRMLAMRRELRGGLSSMIETVDDRGLTELLRAFSAAVGGDHFLNVQLRLTSKGPRIFEINPRFSSTVMMRHRVGFRDLIWAIEAREGRAPPPFAVTAGLKVYRQSREEAFDRDDRPLSR